MRPDSRPQFSSDFANSDYHDVFATITTIIILFLLSLSRPFAWADGIPKLPDGAISSRSFVDQSQIVSNYTKELYAHQSSLRIVKGIGYAVYQCNETTPGENK